MKKLKDMSTSERLGVWADHMVGGKKNKELTKRGVGLRNFEGELID